MQLAGNGHVGAQVFSATQQNWDGLCGTPDLEICPSQIKAHELVVGMVRDFTLQQPEIALALASLERGILIADMVDHRVGPPDPVIQSADRGRLRLAHGWSTTGELPEVARE